MLNDIMEDSALLSIVKLGFDYPHKPVLRNVSFRVAKGTICGLLGPNASGKSTLLKCINGVLRPKEGHVFIGGSQVEDLSRSEIARLMAVVPQQTTVVFAFTALEMVVMGRAARLAKFKLPSSKDYLEAKRCLEELGVGDLSLRRFNELSGGERQLVLLARAMFQDTAILLLDEPTSHLDFKNQFMVMDRMRDMTRAKKLTTIITLHDPNLAGRYCSHMVMLKEGGVHFEGSCDEAIQPSILEGVYDMKVMIESTGQGGTLVVPAYDSRK
jgi:iron complex transport system ATP-binding protein